MQNGFKVIGILHAKVCVCIKIDDERAIDVNHFSILQKICRPSIYEYIKEAVRPRLRNNYGTL